MSWDYRNYPNNEKLLLARYHELLGKIWCPDFDTRCVLLDTRPIHYFLFNGLTPPGQDFFAGHYRGEDFPILRNYVVGVSGNPNVGWPPSLVSEVMSKFGLLLEEGLIGLDNLHQAKTSSKGDRLRKTVGFACKTFIKMGQIHPYANGNGHIARFMLVSILRRYNYGIQRFPIEPRPGEIPYGELIWEYEAGNKIALLETILNLVDTL